MSVETIAARATPSGRGGVGIMRLSGPLSETIAKKILGFLPKARQATFCEFKHKNEVLDEGIALYFPAPHSFTGEAVLELQGHGGPVVVDRLLAAVISHGARLANPGEFSERAFLNNKLDLTQAEAIADLINASSEQAARSAVRSLQGEFSKQIDALSQKLIFLRKLVEASIDFPEEEIDFLAEKEISTKVEGLIKLVSELLQKTKQGVLLREGVTLVIAGRPNAGKSSLLNWFCGQESAIVTEIAGTTRDILKETINLDGMPLHLIDTAGLRETEDVVEQEGVRRARRAIEQADLILLIVDASKNYDLASELSLLWEEIPETKAKVVIIENKIDLIERAPEVCSVNEHQLIRLSVKKGEGVELLKNHLKTVMGYTQPGEDIFTARRRHLEALNRVLSLLKQGHQRALEGQGELLAEELKLAHHSLGEIVGEFSSDALLGEIFKSFCIGK